MATKMVEWVVLRDERALWNDENIDPPVHVMRASEWSGLYKNPHYVLVTRFELLEKMDKINNKVNQKTPIIDNKKALKKLYAISRELHDRDVYGHEEIEHVDIRRETFDRYYVLEITEQEEKMYINAINEVPGIKDKGRVIDKLDGVCPLGIFCPIYFKVKHAN
jgi:hypothetical protein